MRHLWLGAAERTDPDFNPRTREGCDQVTSTHTYPYHHISIHAPVKGATIATIPDVSGVRLISIHAPVKGATDDIVSRYGYTIISIHAPVKGATLVITDESHNLMDFNPRTREGCDMPVPRGGLTTATFQSTHP